MSSVRVDIQYRDAEGEAIENNVTVHGPVADMFCNHRDLAQMSFYYADGRSMTYTARRPL